MSYLQRDVTGPVLIGVTVLLVTETTLWAANDELPFGGVAYWPTLAAWIVSGFCHAGVVLTDRIVRRISARLDAAESRAIMLRAEASPRPQPPAQRLPS